MRVLVLMAFAVVAAGQTIEVKSLDRAEYRESSTVGTKFTFVSDGVVEAENAQRELFGFERRREISGKSAQEIAEAARAWGQNHDTTTVRVRRQA